MFKQTAKFDSSYQITNSTTPKIKNKAQLPTFVDSRVVEVRTAYDSLQRDNSIEKEQEDTRPHRYEKRPVPGQEERLTNPPLTVL